MLYRCRKKRRKSTTAIKQSPGPRRTVSIANKDGVSLDAWLERYKLERYADAIKAAGYDQLQFLKDARP